MDNSTEHPVGDERLPPPRLNGRQETLCERLDRFHREYKLTVQPSDMFRGAVFASGEKLRLNPDWLAQAANSLREVLYPFYRENKKRIAAALQEGGMVRTSNLWIDRMISVYNQASDFTHHRRKTGSTDAKVQEREFQKLLEDFESVMFDILARQDDVHREVDSFFGVASKEKAHDLVSINSDARKYFYHRADARWFDWLRDNNLFDRIKEDAPDKTRYSYSMPELGYLERVAGEIPDKVADFMLEVKSNAEHFNPEVIDRFLRICSSLPADQLARMMGKIKSEQWVQLMAPFNRWGFEYCKMFETLAEVKDYKNTITLAEAVLAIRPKKDGEERGYGDSPFFIRDLSYTKAFEHLVAVDDDRKEAALKLALDTLRSVIKATAHDTRDARQSIFEVVESYYFLDINLFTLQIGGTPRLSARGDLHVLVATVKTLAEQITTRHCTEKVRIESVLAAIETLPACRTRWALRLFVLSLCPQTLSTELKAAWFRIFDCKNNHEVYDLTTGAEYETSLQGLFVGVLSTSEQQEYINKVIGLVNDAKDADERKGYQLIAARILSTLREHLGNIRAHVDAAGIEIDKDHEPGPAIGRSRGGIVIAQAPISPEKFGQLEIPEIVWRFRGKSVPENDNWTPEVLAKRNTSDDFLRPINAEGVGEMLRKDIAKRLGAYIASAASFFDRGKLDAHYTYEYLRGVQETIKADRAGAARKDWGTVISLCQTITNDRDVLKNNAPREREDLGGWLSNWRGVCSSIADVVQELLRDAHGSTVLDETKFRSHRDAILGIIGNLLEHPDPEPKKPDEKGMEPFNGAINTIRGRAFEAFVLFVYRDDKKLGDGVKAMYEKTLNSENTLPIMFMFGHYLPTFYYRDKEWVDAQLPKILPADQAKKDLFLASWEGYLTESLYKELYEKLESTYERAIALDRSVYTSRRYTKDLDEALATHLALAFVHLDLDIDSDLFEKFWTKSNPKRHAEFISFIGRSVITRDKPNEWLKEHGKVDIQKLKCFWEWILRQDCIEAGAYKAFGYWIPRDADMLKRLTLKWLAEKIKQTLKKTQGDIDWGIGLADALEELAGAAPDDTFDIIRSYFKDPGVTLVSSRNYRQIPVEPTLVNVFRILHGHNKQKTRDLVDDLLPINSGIFWPLKDVLKEADGRNGVILRGA